MPSPLLRAPNANHLWAALLVEELVRQGVGLFVIGPGSRSTPLTVAVAQNPRARSLVHIDERGGAFAALGFARATGRPAAWITTSGTAVANGLPAAVEADTAGVPLLLLTADRPPELRDTGANQTVRQPGLFASVARWTADLAPPTPEVDPAYVLTTAAHAVARSLAPYPGPVHLNCPFREPLAPLADGTGTLPDHLHAWAEADRPFTEAVEAETVVPPDAIASVARALEPCQRVLLVAGQGADPASVRAAAERTDWVLLADSLSGAHTPEGVPFYDLALASRAFAEAHVPDAVVHVGARPTSKRLQALLDRSPVTVRIAPTAGRLDPAHRVTHRITADPAFALRDLVAATASRPDPAWATAWRSASVAVSEVLDRELAGEAITEPGIARAVAAHTPPEAGLVVAASMPVRDLDAFGVPRVTVTANRGASGIDGTVATAAGFARGLDAPTVLLIGDLALLHDLNGLALLRDGPPVVIVAINNDGGGIFHFLPIAPEADGPALATETFEPFFGTPHGLGFEAAARQFGLAYHAPATHRAFTEAFQAALASGASALIEVRTDRGENAALHRRLARLGAEAVEGRLGV
ncbi:MAG: 2-succinyl-5-enolpyruvyl-6-hydroxy-3-cyclohexene-1-carboxylic-acid synthase [Bacteroidota bacterium]